MMWVLTCQVAPSAGACPAGESVWLAWSDLASFSVSQLDPTLIAQAFGAGFICVATAFALGRAAGLLLGMIRR